MYKSDITVVCPILFSVNALPATLSSSHLAVRDLGFQVLEIGFKNFKHTFIANLSHGKENICGSGEIGI